MLTSFPLAGCRNAVGCSSSGGFLGFDFPARGFSHFIYKTFISFASYGVSGVFFLSIYIYLYSSYKQTNKHRKGGSTI